MQIPESVKNCFQGDLEKLESWSSTIAEIADLVDEFGLSIISVRMWDEAKCIFFLLRHEEWQLQTLMILSLKGDDQFLMRGKYPFIAVKKTWADICEARFRDIIAPLTCP